MGALVDARVFGRQAPAPNPLTVDDPGERLPHIGVGGLSLRCRFQAIASARDSVWLLVRRNAQEDAAPGRLLDVACGRKARTLGVQDRSAQQPFRAPRDFSLGGRGS